LCLALGFVASESRGFSSITIVRTKVRKDKVSSLIFPDFVRTITFMKKRMGRPPKSGDEAMAGRLEIRVTPAEKDAYDNAASMANLERSDWIRATLNAAAKRVLNPQKTNGERRFRSHPAKPDPFASS
jgi:hypothetical protein